MPARTHGQPQGLPPSVRAATDSLAASFAWLPHCIRHGHGEYMCGNVAKDIANSMDATLARRPGALCFALTECRDAASCAMPVATSNSSAALSFCSSTGLQGGAPARADGAQRRAGSLPSTWGCGRYQ